MTVLKSYTCSKCGGVLNIDSDQEFFDCPFCGNRYDEFDFHEDELFAQAEESLRQKAFPNAREKYKTILEKNPGNFEALRGIVFCETGISSLDDIKTPEDFGKCYLDAAKKAITDAISAADSKGTEYFKSFAGLISAYKAYKVNYDDSKALSSPSNRQYINRRLDEKRERLLGDAKDAHPGPYILGFICGAVMIIIGIVGGDDSGISIAIGMGVIILLLISLGIVKQNKSNADAIPRSVESKYESLKNQVESHKNEYFRKLTALQKLESSAREERLKKEAQNELVEGPKADYSAAKVDASETIECAKCGALLNLDKEKRVYRCDSCGVAYGVSLFFGLPWEKALDAMNSGRYDDAKQRFSNALLVEPSNFEAYLGIILCEGKWAKVSDIDESSEMDTDTSRSIFALIRKAKTQISEADQAYFDELWKLISKLKKLSENNKKLQSNKDELKSIISKHIRLQQERQEYDYIGPVEEIIDTMRGGTDPHSAIYKKLEDGIAECIKERKQLIPEFTALRESVLSLRSDNVFCK